EELAESIGRLLRCRVLETPAGDAEMIYSLSFAQRPTWSSSMACTGAFRIVETTIADIHRAYNDGTLTARRLVQMYLDRIDAYDRNGPAINSGIALNPKALEEADRLDAALKTSGLVGPLHGVPVLMKDQADVAGTPTTLGSLLFKDFMPRRDCFVA